MKPQKLQVGSAYFVASPALLVDSLFNAGGTAAGTFKAYANRVVFSNPKGEPFAALIANPGQGRFFVTCHRCPESGNRIRYMFGLSDLDAVSLGIAALRYSAQCEEADRVWDAAKPEAATVAA
jgi:hypothetical protein